MTLSPRNRFGSGRSARQALRARAGLGTMTQVATHSTHDDMICVPNSKHKSFTRFHISNKLKIQKKTRQSQNKQTDQSRQLCNACTQQLGSECSYHPLLCRLCRNQSRHHRCTGTRLEPKDEIRARRRLLLLVHGGICLDPSHESNRVCFMLRLIIIRNCPTKA